MSTLNLFARGAVALTLVLGACGDDGTNTECGTGTMLVGGECVAGTPTECGAGTMLVGDECVADAVCGTGTVLTNGMCLPNTTPTTTYRQIEHLARPGINEALLITNDFLNGYNATAPAYTGVPMATLNAIVGEAKTVLKAIYLGACLINGAAPGGNVLTADTGVKPAGLTCHAIGPAIWTENSLATGATLTAASQTAAQAYADAVFGLFVPDVMRIDTAITSTYFNLCGAGTGAPGLCGGRQLNEDTIDVTYSFLISGAMITSTANTQFTALVSDGVNFSTTTSPLSFATADANNRNQGHPQVSTTFPYSAAPL